MPFIHTNYVLLPSLYNVCMYIPYPQNDQYVYVAQPSQEGGGATSPVSNEGAYFDRMVSEPYIVSPAIPILTHITNS